MSSDLLEYTLGSYHLVWVHFNGEMTELPRPIAAIAGIAEGTKYEKIWETVWPFDKFERDDIDSHDVQCGYIKHQVGPVVRCMFKSNAVHLLNWKGRVRIQQPGSNPDPYFVGFCDSFLAAAAWVATGIGKPYVPWEGV